VEHAATVRELWTALAAVDLAPLRERLAPDARWRAVENGPWNCDTVRDLQGDWAQPGIRSLRADRRRARARRPGDRRFCPDHHEPGAWPLEDGIRWLVVTFDGDLGGELKGCWTRADAIACVT